MGLPVPLWYLMVACYLWLWFGLLFCMVYGLALCFWKFPNGFWSRPRFSFEMLKNASLCVVFYFFYSYRFRNGFPHDLNGELSEHADMPRKNVSEHELCALGLKDISLINHLPHWQPYHSRGQCKDKEHPCLGGAQFKGRWWGTKRQQG